MESEKRVFRLGRDHSLEVVKINDDCFDVSLIEHYESGRDLKLKAERYSKDALECEYGIKI